MSKLNWDDLRFFLAVARERQISRVGRHLGTSHVTVSRRLNRLEHALNIRLFERNPRGYELTLAGQRLIETIARMEQAAEQIPVEQNPTPGRPRPLRFAMPEGFASLFTRYLLPEFTERFPLVLLEQIAMPQVLSLSRREADISITLDPVTNGPYRSERITDYTLHLYGTPGYLASVPPIQSREELCDHRFIGYIEDMIFAPGLDYLSEVHPRIRPTIKSSSIFNQLAAIRSGLGIGVLPYYMASKYSDLRIVLPDQVNLTRTYWLTCHRDVRQLSRERTIIAFLIDAIREHGDELMRHPNAVNKS